MSDNDSSAVSDSEEEEQSSAADEEDAEFDLAASSTESDEVDDDDDGDNDDESNDSDADEPNKESPKTRTEVIVENMLKRFDERRGKQLYIRFPYRLPKDEQEFNQKIQALSPLISKINKPRQKSYFCTVEFPTQEVRDAALKEIKEKVKSDPNLKRVVVDLPNLEKEDYVKNVVSKKLKTLERKKAKVRLRRANKVALRDKNFTSSVVVLNLPKSSTIAEVRQLFPTAVDVEIKSRKDKMNNTSLATVTLPTPMDARVAVKKKLHLGETQLKICFHRNKVKIGNKKNKKQHKTATNKPVPNKEQQQAKAIKRKPPQVEQEKLHKQNKIAKKAKV